MNQLPASTTSSTPMSLTAESHAFDVSTADTSAANVTASQFSASGAGPAESEIASEAYIRYLNRGCEDGHALEDWLEAERSLRERYAEQTTAH